MFNTPKIIIDDLLKPDDKIYRYISLKQFLYFIECKKTYLTRVCSWEDNWEAPISRLPLVKDDGGLAYASYSSAQDLFGQCWTLKAESDAMWKIYSPFKDGIKITTSIDKFNLIGELIHANVFKVKYFKDIKEVRNLIDQMKCMPYLISEGLVKREAFEHEDEVRLITLNDKRLIKETTKGDYLELPLDPIEFIEEIIIDPRAEGHYIQTIKEYCKRAGLKVEPKQSKLYGDVFEQTKLAIYWKPVNNELKKFEKTIREL